LLEGFAPHAKVIGGKLPLQLELSSVRSQNAAPSQSDFYKPCKYIGKKPRGTDAESRGGLDGRIAEGDDTEVDAVDGAIEIR